MTPMNKIDNTDCFVHKGVTRFIKKMIGNKHHKASTLSSMDISSRSLILLKIRLIFSEIQLFAWLKSVVFTFGFLFAVTAYSADATCFNEIRRAPAWPTDSVRNTVGAFALTEGMGVWQVIYLYERDKQDRPTTRVDAAMVFEVPIWWFQCQSEEDWGKMQKGNLPSPNGKLSFWIKAPEGRWISSGSTTSSELVEPYHGGYSFPLMVRDVFERVVMYDRDRNPFFQFKHSKTGAHPGKDSFRLIRGAEDREHLCANSVDHVHDKPMTNPRTRLDELCYSSMWGFQFDHHRKEFSLLWYERDHDQLFGEECDRDKKYIPQRRYLVDVRRGKGYKIFASGCGQRPKLTRFPVTYHWSGNLDDLVPPVLKQ